MSSDSENSPDRVCGWRVNARKILVTQLGRVWEGWRGDGVRTGGPIGTVWRIDDRWGWRRVEYRGWGWGGEWVERILERRRASAIGLL